MVKLGVYSQAFFEVALERGTVDQYQKEAGFVLSVFNENPDLMKLLLHPKISSEQKFNLLKELFENKVSVDFLGLFNTILTKRRETAFVGILQGFLENVLEYKTATIAKVFTPTLPTAEQQRKIKEKLSIALKKQVQLEIIIEPKLVAGLKIIADGAVIDTSFKKQMAEIKNNMHNHLAKEVINAT